MAATGAKGAFDVVLNSLTWNSNGALDEEASRHIYCYVQLVLPSEQPLDNVWFAAGTENMMTRSVSISAKDCGQMLQLEYKQSSRAIPLSSENMQELVQAQLLLSLYSGTFRDRLTDSFLCKALVPLSSAFLEGNLQHQIQLASSEETFVLEINVLCDVALADCMLGARLLQLYSPQIVQLPSKWTGLESTSNEEAVQYCASIQQNAAFYELTIAIPRFEETKNRVDDGAEMKDVSLSGDFKLTTLKGGKLYFCPTFGVSEESRLVQLPTAGADEGPDITNSTMSGEWSVRFPSTAIISILYLKNSMNRLIEFLTVEKYINGTLRRSFIESASEESVDTISSDFRVNLNELLAPGITQVVLTAPLRAMSPVSRAFIEQKVASAASIDEKKKSQAALADYETTSSETASLTAEAMTIGTHIKIVAGILNKPLVLAPPQILGLPSKSIAQLISPRDVVDEGKKSRDVYENLRTEIRMVAISLLSEYKELFSNSDKRQETDDTGADAASNRDYKKQTLIYRLNTQGIYHLLKESLKKRIVPVIREAFTRNEIVSDEFVNNAQAELDMSMKGDAREQFGQLYTRLMHEVNAILKEVFYSDSNALLEKAYAAAEGHPSLKEVKSVLNVLRIKALENEVNGDFEKSEMLHLDRIAYAEQHAAHVKAILHDQKLTDRENNCGLELLINAWYDYAFFCMSQTKLEKSVAALQECLRLDSHFILALIDLVGVHLELSDFAQVELIVKNAVLDAKAAVQSSRVDSAEHCVLAHALFAYYFSQIEESDPTGNFMLFELLNAQQMLQVKYSGGEINEASCLSAVWVILANYAYERKLWGIMQRSLHFAEKMTKTHDVYGCDLRVMKRVMEAEIIMRESDAGAGEGEFRAIKILQEALEVDSYHPIAWLTLGKVYFRQDSHNTTAIECLQRSFEHHDLLTSDASRLGLYLRLGLALLHSSQFEKADAVFLFACDKFRVASCWLGVGIANLRLEKWERAQMALAEANRLDHSNPDVWGYLALLALTAHTSKSTCDEKDAMQFISKALEHNVSNPALLRELSNAFVAIDRLESAERLLRRSLSCQDSILTRKTLADVLAAQNCAEDALRHYVRLLEVTEDIEERHVLLENCARLLEFLGRSEEAAEYRSMATQIETHDRQK
ncbi:Tetratricopeptide repeat-containing domain [Plasmopara halstedii]|uniref:Tetratricopeptide repeat-containing domain n=1 Tax=Plasmopara halstedii TaxID=4781 RepID=A0A0P1B2J0_PLAHL|nr:Tetratricopeptide repeat-containing domain [Plasmopara halstedii]CEG48031.1 Tetratricopeptide repeat-containing domain [Plasmopara halstedii]|eukprot:XP_024584400.1 Tetratricopeptide repeat-containing domain [Plasmopara halstedii]